jgi:hypothetical protein
MTAEGDRVAGFGKLEDGLRQSSPWYTWGPYVSERLDALPSHAWNRWRYHYPQAAFPYDQLRTENSRRDRRSPEYEILDTGVFDQDRYWITEVAYAKSDDARELLIEISATNVG